MRIAITGAAPMPRPVPDFFLAIDVPLSEVYGMSECSGPMTWTLDAHQARHGGPAIPGQEVKLLDDGEVCCRDGNVFSGYLKTRRSAPTWARSRGIEFSSVAELAAHPDVRAEIEWCVEEANGRFSQVERIKKIAILPTEWLPDSDELTPTMKLKRRGVLAKYADEIGKLYG